MEYAIIVLHLLVVYLGTLIIFGHIERKSPNEKGKVPCLTLNPTIVKELKTALSLIVTGRWIWEYG